MDPLCENLISCPYCGEPIEVLVDVSELGHTYIEDCAVCCRPINFHITQDALGELLVSVFSEDEV